MKCRVLLVAWGLVATLAAVDRVCAQSSAFTYQGRLTSTNGAALSGSYDFQFKLLATSTTNQVGSTLTNAPVAVSNGLFTVTLDFGGLAFDASPRWLQIGVRTNGSTNAYDVLLPTQPVGSAPYSYRAAVATTYIGDIIDTQLSTNIPRFTTGGEFTGPVTLDNGTVTGTFSGTGSGSFSGNFTGSTTGTNNGTFIGNGAGITNVNVTNITGLVQSNPNWQFIQTNGQLGVIANNYLATNAAQIALQLPVSPNVGGTLRIAGTGAGGWILGQGAGQSIYTGSLGLPAGRSWTNRAGTNAWRGVASSSDGLKMATVINVGNIFTSVNGGASWVRQATNLGNLAWIDIASSANGNKLVAAVNSGFIYTSTDSGSNWTQRATNRAWISVASSISGTRLAAAVNNGFIYTSSDSGSNWTQRATNLPWISIASSSDGIKLAAAINNGLIYTSADSGATWVARASTQPWTDITSSADGRRLAATANGTNIFVSGDSGANWSPRATVQTWQTISSSADGERLVAGVGGVGSLFTSFDGGDTWVARATNMAWIGSVFSADGTRAAATVNVGQIFVSTAATTPGVTGSLVGDQFSTVELQYIGNGLWMPLSSSGSFTGN